MSALIFRTLTLSCFILFNLWNQNISMIRPDFMLRLCALEALSACVSRWLHACDMSL